MKIHSIFQSISGEVGVWIPQGSFTTFIRMQGCSLRCGYCDTKQSQSMNGGTEMAIDQIKDKVISKNVIITGGEPLMQEDELKVLVYDLHMNGCAVQIETNGHHKIHPEWPCCWVIDYKGPSSLMEYYMPSAEEFIQGDFWSDDKIVIKFVIDKEPDLYTATSKIASFASLGYTGKFALSPINGDPHDVHRLVGTLPFFLDQHLLDRVIISLQIHKICQLA